MNGGMIMMTKQHDEGFTLIEVLLVIVVLGILATVVVVSVGGLSTGANDSGCKSDAHILATAAEAYFAQRETQVIPAADAGSDGVEKTLVAEGLIRSPSTLHDLDTNGALKQAAGSPCTV